MQLHLKVLPETLAICRLPPTANIPNWALTSGFLSMTRTEDELSLVCLQNYVPEDIKVEPDWRAIKVSGPLDFSLTGILANLANTLAEAEVSIFAISTFDTDYVLVKKDKLEDAKQALIRTGHHIR